jgi:hypothetical protein
LVRDIFLINPQWSTSLQDRIGGPGVSRKLAASSNNRTELTASLQVNLPSYHYFGILIGWIPLSWHSCLTTRVQVHSPPLWALYQLLVKQFRLEARIFSKFSVNWGLSKSIRRLKRSHGCWITGNGWRSAHHNRISKP